MQQAKAKVRLRVTYKPISILMIEPSSRISTLLKYRSSNLILRLMPQTHTIVSNIILENSIRM